MMAAASVKWSDMNDDEFNFDDDFAGLVKVEGDIKTTTQYEAEGSIKVVTKSRIHRRVERASRVAIERKARMSRDKEKDKKISTGEECFIELPKSMRKVDDDDDNDGYIDRDVNVGIPNTKKDFVREKFALLKKLDRALENSDLEDEFDMAAIRQAEYESELQERPERYQPPKGRTVDLREDATVRVTNLSEETEEEDLEELFGKIGKIHRIYLAKNKESKASKGFAFITYDDRATAEKAIRQLDRHGYDSLLLKVEWSKASAKTAA